MSNIAKWKQVSKEEFAQLVKESRSIRELADKLGYACDGGGTAKSLKEAIKLYDLDCSHFLGQGWNKNNFDYFSCNHIVGCRNCVISVSNVEVRVRRSLEGLCQGLCYAV